MKTIILLTSLAIASPILTAKPVEIDLRPGVAARGGEWTYQIGRTFVENGQSEPLPFPISELEWPMDSSGLSLGVSATTDRLTLNLETRFSGGDAGTLKDSDWEDENDPNLKTTYSESNAEVIGFEGDASASLRFLGDAPKDGGWGLSAGAGYLYQHWEWEGRDTEQVEVGIPVGAFFPGKVITYEGDLEMPYVMVGGHLSFASFILTARAGYSPWVNTTDEDNHLLRGIVAEADTDGDGYFADAGIDIPVGKEWGFFGTASLLYFKTDGMSRNTAYQADAESGVAAGDTWDIYQEIESVQAAFTAGVRFSL